VTKEQLKSEVYQKYFAKLHYSPNIDNIDFVLTSEIEEK